jgi:hypothetical protein
MELGDHEASSVEPGPIEVPAEEGWVDRGQAQGDHAISAALTVTTPQQASIFSRPFPRNAGLRVCDALLHLVESSNMLRTADLPDGERA